MARLAGKQAETLELLSLAPPEPAAYRKTPPILDRCTHRAMLQCGLGSRVDLHM